ncbi:hypothetical protein [Microbulbifer sediminum]|uniref:hypothetical protein n=1 Tax=Microbulbifer sediminum TaxID=2904250 RepID=UPI001F3E09A4|nr:hypothetical protein [Microbulbifer sediminum]
MSELGRIFPLDICAYVVMSNHYHVVLHINSAEAASWEDRRSGRFWEGRALLNEQALAACMTYVDLNPIRAYMAKTPESSDHTSIK